MIIDDEKTIHKFIDDIGEIKHIVSNKVYITLKHLSKSILSIFRVIYPDHIRKIASCINIVINKYFRNEFNKTSNYTIEISRFLNDKKFDKFRYTLLLYSIFDKYNEDNKILDIFIEDKYSYNKIKKDIIIYSKQDFGKINIDKLSKNIINYRIEVEKEFVNLLLYVDLPIKFSNLFIDISKTNKILQIHTKFLLKKYRKDKFVFSKSGEEEKITKHKLFSNISIIQNLLRKIKMNKELIDVIKMFRDLELDDNFIKDIIETISRKYININQNNILKKIIYNIKTYNYDLDISKQKRDRSMFNPFKFGLTYEKYIENILKSSDIFNSYFNYKIFMNCKFHPTSKLNSRAKKEFDFIIGYIYNQTVFVKVIGEIKHSSCGILSNDMTKFSQTISQINDEDNNEIYIDVFNDGALFNIKLLEDYEIKYIYNVETSPKNILYGQIKQYILNVSKEKYRKIIDGTYKIDSNNTITLTRETINYIYEYMKKTMLDMKENHSPQIVRISMKRKYIK